MRATDDRLLGRRDGTGIDIFDSAAKITHEMVMMAAEGVCQLVASKPLLKLQAPNDA
jgi:hypothetical protein